MMDKHYHKVYIIESPSPNDILDKRKEGSALSEILSLACIPNTYYNVVNKATFVEAFDRIVEDIKRPDITLGSVYLHFSMHGNSDGIALTSDEFVTWQELYPIIKQFNDSIGYGTLHWAPGKKYSFANLNFSVCDGFNAAVMSKFGEESPYTTVLGPTCEVDWSDSLMAFATYYHHTINKGVTWWESVPIMNLAAGVDSLFHLQLADGLYIGKRPALG